MSDFSAMIDSVPMLASAPPAAVISEPVAALTLHTGMNQWFGTESHRIMCAAFSRAFAGSPGRVVQPSNWDSKLNADHFMRDETRWIKGAETCFISPDVAELVEKLAETMPPDMLRESDLPMEQGFIVLGKCWGYWIYDDGDYQGRLPIRAVAWRRTDTVGRLDDDTGERTYHPGVQLLVYGDGPWAEKAYDLSNYTKMGRAPGYLHDFLAWSFDTWWRDKDSEEETDHHHTAPHVGELRRKLLALWRFMADEIVTTDRDKMPRAAMRRWGRTGEIPEDGSITTVRLRKIHHEDAGEPGIGAARDWTHRWWVIGHPRRNPKTGLKDIWVRPYLKGPDGLPIVIKTRNIIVDR